MATCCIKGCEKNALARGMCAMHYRRQSLYGDPTAVKLRQLHGADLATRLAHYTKKGAGCWEWTGSRDPNGYGRLNIGGYPALAHRLSWQVHCHEISPEQHVLHRCDNPACVRPDHLFLGDQADNNHDMIAKGRFSPGVSLGEDHGHAKLTDDDVRAIRAHPGPQTAIAKQFGISQAQVSDIKRRKSWAHLK